MLRRVTAVLLISTAAQFLGGCSFLDRSIGYYTQSAFGHLDLMRRSRPIDDWLADAQTSGELRQQLERVLAMREFAVASLSLPDNGSYLDYADLGREHVVWNVFATPELSLEPVKSCFPVVGCLSYRGYFEQADAEREAERLRALGHDVFVGGVSAYSTLGWFADPVLNTMLRWSEPRLASVLFHEMAHQKVYLDDDSAFNEAFATAVGDIGVTRWLEANGQAQRLQSWREYKARKTDFIELVNETAGRLRRLYARQADVQALRAAKKEILEDMRRRYYAMRDGDWAGYNGYDEWFTQVNNARIAAVSTYHEWVPAFLNLLDANGGDLQAFYQACTQAGALSPEQRRVWLRQYL